MKEKRNRVGGETQKAQLQEEEKEVISGIDREKKENFP